MRELFGKLLRERCGATAIEYALIAALIVIAMVGALRTLGDSNGGAWGNMVAKVSAAES